MTTGYNILCTLHPSLVSIPFYAIPIPLSIIHRIFYLLVIIAMLQFSGNRCMSSLCCIFQAKHTIAATITAPPTAVLSNTFCSIHVLQQSRMPIHAHNYLKASGSEPMHLIVTLEWISIYIHLAMRPCGPRTYSSISSTAMYKDWLRPILA